MSPLLVQLLRRVAVWSLVLAVLLLVVPRLLTHFGVIGPTLEQVVESATQSLEAARAYGADEGLAPFSAAVRELERARELGRRGQKGEARRAAARASAAAIEAQRIALSRREEEKRRAEAIVTEISELLNELEDLYADVAPGLDKAEVARLLSLMKQTRRAGAALVLASEQGSYGKVIEDEMATRKQLAAARETLRRAQK